MNKSVLWKKGLVVGIIILFVGVGLNPAVAVNPNISVIIKQEEVIEDNTDISGNEEDCGCNPVDEVDIDSLSNSVKVFTSFVSVISRGNPEIREKCEEISDIINSDGFLEIFCDALAIFLDVMIMLLADIFPESIVDIIIIILLGPLISLHLAFC